MIDDLGSDGDDINFQEQVSVPPPSYPDPSAVGPYPPNGMNSIDGNNPAAVYSNLFSIENDDFYFQLANSSSTSSMTIYIIIGVVVLLIIGGIVGYFMIKKKKQATNNPTNKGEEVLDGRTSFTSSVGSMVE